ncbi:MAG TPA: serine hydrolase [Candidatus Limnocylindria bacterium]|nr:serine hydrolase [Candidatus Limnocylindria bacterium]
MIFFQNRKFFLSEVAVLAAALLFGLGILVGFKLNRAPQSNNEADVLVRAGGYKFTNPLLDCDDSQNYSPEFSSAKAELVDFANQEQQKSNEDFIAVYYRDLNTGRWFGINENATFAPASLLKVPLMMAYYKMSENDPSVMGKSYIYKQDAGNPDSSQTIKPEQTLEDGKSYTVKDLIYRMIVYSDNRAFYLLTADVDLTILKKIFNEFVLHYPTDPHDNILVNVRDYSGFYRILYNATYLNRANSEEALNILSQVEFKNGLVAGVPANVTVAHKFGEREVNPGVLNQLHDCGIVYYPGHPYILCVMTRGSDTQKLETTAASISKIVYSKVDGQFGNENK